MAVDEDRPLVGQVRPRDALDQRRLAGAVVADERDDLGRVDLEVDVGQRLDRAEALRDSFQLDDRRADRRGGGASAAPSACGVTVSVGSYLQMLTFGIPLQTFERPPYWLLIQPFLTSSERFELVDRNDLQEHGRHVLAGRS